MSKLRTDHSQWDESALRRAVDSAGIALWSWNVDTDDFDMDERGFALWSVAPHEDLTFEHLSEKVHPADRDRVRAAFLATRAIVGPYEIDFRTLIGKKVRWISARGTGSDENIVRRVVMGVFLDVTGRKQAEESSELLAGEMSHRVKNLLTIASGLARITSRSSSNVTDMAAQLTHRLTALGRAHDLVRPLPGSQGDAALLGDIFSVLLAPYDDKGAFAGRIRIAVPRMGVGEAAAASLALVVHELATNSLKYGALSSDEGLLDVSGCVVADKVRIIWTEHGGPEVAPPSEGQEGYGSKLVRNTVQGALGGSINYEWSKAGALVTLEVKAELLAA
ncbi:MAG: HWE histidine kinase domain-containing protein [Cypionkella sp.]|uniref:sensor histidine kinase n=1 Tax=Cypionkella sp. TaxID=2811411 RepID=UPI002ABBB095|nr:HWE histidine kinase domain-containing protein [Cypionkella sp.]MDZ4310102.1 HWE histidine kinase domain-containing protein [Cypionkella sp.]MDZ4392694.1 HWE histidine kinase domain-containing protein [Cypionkella sp.]